MKSISIVIILFLFSTAHAQTLNWQWATGPVGQCVVSAMCTDADKHEYVTGHFLGHLLFGNDSVIDNLGPYQDVFIAKYDAQGNVLWVRSANGYADAQSISVDSGGNVYMVGDFYNDSITFGNYVLTDATMGNSNVFLVKYDSLGNVLWAEKPGGPGNDFTFGINCDVNNNVYITGYFTGDSLALGNIILHQSGTDNVFLAKYNPSGNVLWAHSEGCAQYDGPNAMCTYAGGNVYVTGYFTAAEMAFGYDTLNSRYPYSIFTVKYDSSGNVLWAKYAGNNYGNSSTAIAADAMGDVYVTGFYTDMIVFANDTLAGNGYQNIFLVKYDSAGTLLWAVSEEGTNIDQANGITIDTSGIVWIAGYFESDTAVFGGVELFNPVGSGNEVSFVVAYDPFGNAVAGIIASGGSTNGAVAIACGNGDIYVTGTYQSADIIFGSDTLLQQNIYLAKLDTTFFINGIAPVAKLSGQILVYPNPSTGNFYFKGLTGGNTIDIYNLLGQCVFSSNTDDNMYTVNLAGRATGVYLYRITRQDGIVQQGKLVVE